MDPRIFQSSLIGGLLGGVASLGLYCLWSHGRKSQKKEILRLETGDPRASAIVKYQGIVYLSGQVGDIPKVSRKMMNGM